MLPGEKILAEIRANGEVFFSRVDFRLETLVVVHEEFHSRNVSRLLRRLHVADEVVHPQHKIAYHAQEPEQVSGISQLVLPGLDRFLEEAPGLDHFLFPVRDIFGLCLRERTFFKNLMDY